MGTIHVRAPSLVQALTHHFSEEAALEDHEPASAYSSFSCVVFALSIRSLCQTNMKTVNIIFELVIMY